jgi:hypothetical protein
MYRNTLRSRAARLQFSTGGGNISETLSEEAINSFLESLVEIAPRTVVSYRQSFLALWRAAADEDLAPYPNARRIRRPKLPPLVVECYTVSEVNRLVKAARQLVGRVPRSHVKRRDYWPALIMAAWDSGLRRGDLWRLNASKIRRDGMVVQVQHKTQKLIVCQFRPETMRAIRAAGNSLAWTADNRTFSEHFTRIVEASGVRRGTFKWVRRASGSYVERAQPGAGCKHLGNTPQVFDAHYDAKLKGRRFPLPPALDATA